MTINQLKLIIDTALRISSETFKGMQQDISDNLYLVRRHIDSFCAIEAAIVELDINADITDFHKSVNKECAQDLVVSFLNKCEALRK